MSCLGLRTSNIIPAINHKIKLIQFVAIAKIPAIINKIPASLGFLLIKIPPIIARINGMNAPHVKKLNKPPNASIPLFISVIET